MKDRRCLRDAAVRRFAGAEAPPGSSGPLSRCLSRLRSRREGATTCGHADERRGDLSHEPSFMETEPGATSA